MTKAIQFFTDCYLDGMSSSKAAQMTSAIFDIDGDVLSQVSDAGIAAANKEYSRMEQNKCV